MQVWGSADAPDAHAWALSQPPGNERDALLGALIAGAASAETPEPRLLNGFSKDRARQRSIQRVVMVIARRSQDEARAFADTYVTDPALRAEVESLITSAQQSRSFGFVTAPQFVPGVVSGETRVLIGGRPAGDE
jgi:hypothetical protein